MRVKWLAAFIALALLLGVLPACSQTASPPPAPTSAPAPTAAPAAPTVAMPTPAPTATLPAPTATAAPKPVAFPVTVKDDVGRSVTIDKAPTKIISLAPSNTEVLFALGLGDRVVGVTDFCDYPAEAKQKPKMGGIKPSLEKIVAAGPDLVLAIAETNGAPEVAQKLQDLKINVIVVGPKNIDGIMASIQLIGKVTGKSEQAANLVMDIKAKIDGVVEKTRTASRPRVMYELDATDPAKPYTPGPGSFIDGMLTMAGAANIAADAKLEWAQLSLEEVVKKDPEIIILGDANYGITADQVKARPGWSTIKACKDNKVIGIDDNLISRPGPRVGDGLIALAKIVHPELFN